MKHLRWVLAALMLIGLVAPMVADAAGDDGKGLFFLDRPSAACKDEKPQTSFSDIFGDKPNDSCSGWCTCSDCGCSGSLSCCLDGCDACWDYRDSRGFCDAI